ncbi:1782_t:CDS:2 [Racocetra persica]|uniref:1782_t:CDS:1 n=1 Tax=Racocetra persica TaxID=160502 RepID=A0ACA9KP36_9GLOM|nr:1782_t:CDS:2 [Racocetra persica]
MSFFQHVYPTQSILKKALKNYLNENLSEFTLGISENKFTNKFYSSWYSQNNFKQNSLSYDSVESIMNSKLAVYSYNSELVYSNNAEHLRPILAEYESFSKRSLGMLLQKKQDKLFEVD